MRKLHAAAGVIAFVTIATFWTSTVIAEAIGSHDGVVQVKTGILWEMPLLVPAMAVVGATGFRMAGRAGNALVAAKRNRMPLIAANGLLILLPSAVVLQGWAAAGRFDEAFYAVQGVELTMGAVNLVLMGLNIRDGLRLSGRRSATTEPHVGVRS